MKIFVSWSGERSRAVALALKEWLPDVLQEAVIWMSEHDIDAGARWSKELGQVLEECHLGIVCLTPESQDSRWVLFEAGALSKSVLSARVIPYLIGMSHSDVQSPLSQFQAVCADATGTFKLIESINGCSNSPLPLDRLRRLHERWWPDLAGRITTADRRPLENVPVHTRSDRDVLNEVLDLVRDLTLRKPRSPNHAETRTPDNAKPFVEIDSRPFFGEKGGIDRVSFSPRTTISRFLDDVYHVLKYRGYIPAYTYGDAWLLRSERTGKLYDNIGIQYCRSRGQCEEQETILSTGMAGGDKLLVVCTSTPNNGTDQSGR